MAETVNIADFEGIYKDLFGDSWLQIWLVHQLSR